MNWRHALAAAIAAPTLAMAQGTASLSPAFPPRGTTATVTFNATGGPLAAQPAVTMTVGFNGFQSATDIPLTGSSPTWSGSFSVPANATSIDVVFKNPSGSIFDNNGGPGADWQFVVAEALTVEAGAEKLPASVGGGFLFRVWAPNVSSASVVGGFNSFNGTRDRMSFHAPSGTWTAHVPGATAGAEYKFLLDGDVFRRDPRGRAAQGDFDNSVLVDPSTFAFTSPRPGTDADFRDWVIYQAHIGSFDPAGGIAPGGFADLMPARLDYLQALGINAIKLLPVNEFPGSLSGGYNLTDPFAIERDYGAPDEFRAFVEACHARGIAVIVDIVHNHYGPGGLELYDFEDANGSGSSDEPGIYFYDSPPELAETPFGPRPDYSDPQVRAFIKDSVRMFLDEYRADGFRWDFTKAMRGTVDGSFNVTADLADGISLLQEINSTLIAATPGVITIAEDIAGDARLTNPVASVSGNANDGFGFDAQWDPTLVFSLVPQLAQPNEALVDLNAVSSAITTSFSRVHYIESHDEVWELNNKDRVPARIDAADPESLRARKMCAIGATILLTTEGVPMIFMGSEILDNGGADGSWDVDEPIDFTRLSDPRISGFRDLYRDLIRLRRNLDGTSVALVGGDSVVYHTNDGAKVLAYARSNGGVQPGDTVVVLVNFSTTSFTGGYSIGMPEAGTWYEVMNTDSTAYGPDFGNVGAGQEVTTTADPQHGFAQRASIVIGPRSAVVLSQANPVAARVTGWQVLGP